MWRSAFFFVVAMNDGGEVVDYFGITSKLPSCSLVWIFFFFLSLVSSSVCLPPFSLGKATRMRRQIATGLGAFVLMMVVVAMMCLWW